MRKRIGYSIVFAILLIAEILIGRFATGFVRSYIGDVLVIPTIYFLLRIIFSKDNIFSVYVLPLLCYCLGRVAEFLQLIDITGILGIDKGSLLGILIGGSFDLRDILAYLVGLYLIGIYLALESRRSTDGRKWWYPIAVFLHCTWGYTQTVGGLILYLWYIRCPHSYYGEVIRTKWPLKMGLSLGLFIFTPEDPREDDTSEAAAAERKLNEEMAVHEYGHTFQALLFGPLYLIVVGIPSLAWGLIPAFKKMRSDKGISYTSLFCEKWASDWGEAVTGKKALRT